MPPLARCRAGRHNGPAVRRILPLIVALLLPLATHAVARQPTVVVLSWDGVRHDYPDRTTLPNLARIARDGARAERLVPPFPSSTFPSHVTLATGARVDRHGIVANAFRDRTRGPFVYLNDASWIAPSRCGPPPSGRAYAARSSSGSAPRPRGTASRRPTAKRPSIPASARTRRCVSSSPGSICRRRSGRVS